MQRAEAAARKQQEREQAEVRRLAEQQAREEVQRAEAAARKQQEREQAKAAREAAPLPPHPSAEERNTKRKELEETARVASQRALPPRTFDEKSPEEMTAEATASAERLRRENARLAKWQEAQKKKIENRERANKQARAEAEEERAAQAPTHHIKCDEAGVPFAPERPPLPTERPHSHGLSVADLKSVDLKDSNERGLPPAPAGAGAPSAASLMGALDARTAHLDYQERDADDETESGDGWDSE